MAKVIGKNVLDRGVYEATELMGQGLVRLQLVDQMPEPRDDVIKVQISKHLAQQVGPAKQRGETLAQALERLALAGLTGPADPADCARSRSAKREPSARL